MQRAVVLGSGGVTGGGEKPIIELLRSPHEDDPHVEQRVIQVEHQAIAGPSRIECRVAS